MQNIVNKYAKNCFQCLTLRKNDKIKFHKFYVFKYFETLPSDILELTTLLLKK